MALSKILREPRRGITEQALGIVVVLVPLYLDYRFGVWLQSYLTMNESPNGAPQFWDGAWVLGMVFGPLAVLAILALAVGVHNLGEGLANHLADRGLELRPTRRIR